MLEAGRQGESARPWPVCQPAGIVAWSVTLRNITVVALVVGGLTHHRVVLHLCHDQRPAYSPLPGSLCLPLPFCCLPASSCVTPNPSPRLDWPSPSQHAAASSPRDLLSLLTLAPCQATIPASAVAAHPVVANLGGASSGIARCHASLRRALQGLSCPPFPTSGTLG